MGDSFHYAFALSVMSIKLCHMADLFKSFCHVTVMGQ